MGGRLTLRLVLLGVVYSMLSSPLIRAQLPRRIEKCLPDPTLAQEIQDMLDETEAPQVKDPKLAAEINEMLAETTPRVTIDKITFPRKTPLPKSAIDQIAARFEGVQSEMPGPWHVGAGSVDPDWLDGVGEELREVWRERGYYYANVSVQVEALRPDPTDQHVSLAVHVKEGPRFRLGTIRFVGAHVFAAAELRKAFPIRDGAIFDIATIRSSIEVLKRLYDTRGYINFVATPDLQVDLAHRRISVIVDLDEEKQYRVRSVTVLSLDQPALEEILKAKLRPGDIFNPEVIKDFYNENKSLLPPDVGPEDWDIKQNEKAATVDLVFDFWQCPMDP
jgi:outer membrane protein assembly factor BamA